MIIELFQSKIWYSQELLVFDTKSLILCLCLCAFLSMYLVACSRRSGSRVQSSDGGVRVKSYAGENEGRLGRVNLSPALWSRALLF